MNSYLTDSQIDELPELNDLEYELEPEDLEPVNPFDDYSDDGDAFASAGWGTDEDYGFYGDCEY